jgi:flagellar motor switch protein FliN/FliY
VEIVAGVDKERADALVAALHPAGPAPTLKALDVLLDVELPVSVSFGRAEIALKDVLKLTTGSILELDRTIAEPVEIIVNNCTHCAR